MPEPNLRLNHESISDVTLDIDMDLILLLPLAVGALGTVPITSVSVTTFIPVELLPPPDHAKFFILDSQATAKFAEIPIDLFKSIGTKCD